MQRLDMNVELHKLLHQLTQLQTITVWTSQPDNDFETVRGEDTPQVAVARQHAVSTLKGLLVQMTTRCAIIQREPGNALARFLFSAELEKNDFDDNDVQDVLLPTHTFYDKSICSELTKAGYSKKDMKRVCTALCTESIKSVNALCRLKKNGDTPWEVRVNKNGEYQFEVKSGPTACLMISTKHLEALKLMYTAKDDPSHELFNQRLFCLLMRYETVGGPMYQCSCTQKTFSVLQDKFGVTKECFASPFNHNADIYWSAFRDTDGPFGSQGSFFTSLRSPFVVEGGSFYANPPFVEEHLQALAKCIEQLLLLPVPVSFICLFPTWTDETGYRMLQKKPYCKLCEVLEVGEHAYVDGNQQVNTKQDKKHHMPKFKTTLFIIQNDMGGKQWSVNSNNISTLRASFLAL